MNAPAILVRYRPKFIAGANYCWKSAYKESRYTRKPGGLARMVSWKLKSCPRCNGDLFIQREMDGWYEACLACGYRMDISNLVAANALGQVRLKDQIIPVNKTNNNV